MISPQFALPLYMSRQAPLWCGVCGREGKLKKGRCPACYSREIRNQRCFAGLRPRVLDRDHGACRVCGRPGSGNHIHVHHRRPGVSNSNCKARFLITLCPGHHALVHRLQVGDRILPALLVELWREQHPQASEQLALFLTNLATPGILTPAIWEISAE